ELLFTSGTTSMPKGAMITHGSTYLAAMNFALSLSRGVRHDCDLKVATFLPMIYHIGDQLFTFSAFLAGGSIVLGRRPTPDAVAEAIATERPTALWAGSPQFVAALATTLDEQPALDVSSLTMLVYGWGALSPELLAGLEKRIGPNFLTL